MSAAATEHRRPSKLDHFLLRLKDGLLIGLSLVTVYRMVVGHVLAPIVADNRVANLEGRLNDEIEADGKRQSKYIPIIESNDKAVAVMVAQQSQILTRLERIERKVDNIKGG